MENEELIEQDDFLIDWETIAILFTVVFSAMLFAMILAMLIVRHIV